MSIHSSVPVAKPSNCKIISGLEAPTVWSDHMVIFREITSVDLEWVAPSLSCVQGMHYVFLGAITKMKET